MTTVIEALENAKRNFVMLGETFQHAYNPYHLHALAQLTSAIEALKEGKAGDSVLEER